MLLVATMQIYVPVLLNFCDNGLVYSSEDLEALKARVMGEDNGVVATSDAAHEFGHRLTDDALRESLLSVATDADDITIVDRVEVYYYHHRIILKYVVREPSGASLSGAAARRFERDARRLALNHSRHVLVTKFVERINTAGADGGPVPDPSGTVTSFYSHCVLFVPQMSDIITDVENLLGSLTFRIVEVTPSLLARNRIHLVRISIPSTTVYSDVEVRKGLRVDVLNATYQHLLYAKKEQDEEERRSMTSFSVAGLEKLNVMEEPQLRGLWEHAVDALGGRMVDLQAVHQQMLAIRLSILALALGFVGVVLSLVLAL